MQTNVATEVFNALSGEELIQVIVKTLSEALEAKLRDSGEFRAHNTFPWVKVGYGLTVLAYPQQSMGDEPRIKVDGSAEVGEETASEPITIEVAEAKTITQPDKERVDAGLPVPTIAQGPGGAKIDKPIIRGNAKGGKGGL